MDDEEYLQPVLTSQEEEDNFQSLDTVRIAAIPLVFGVSTLVLGVVTTYRSCLQTTNDEIYKELC